jgi:hypothetical protein
MTGRRRIPVLAVAAGLLAGLTACGGSSGATGTDASAAVSSPTALATPTDRSPHGVLLTAQLAARNARRAEFKYRLGSSEAQGMLFWAPKTVLKLSRPESDDQVIVLDTTAYLGGGPATALRLNGRHWEKYTGGLDADGQKQVPYAALVDRLNPMVALTAAVAVDSPLLVGEEQLQDATVEHYRVTMPTSAYAAAQTQLSAARRAALQTALGGGALTLDLWLNDKDQLVQLRRVTAQADDTVTYSDYAGPLSVQAPAEADTADAPAGQGPPPLP